MRAFDGEELIHLSPNYFSKLAELIIIFVANLNEYYH